MKISVIIPFYQREQGILRRALMSVLSQQISDDVEVNIIVVDDGSPVSAQSEVEGLAFAPPFYLNIITKPNAGVAAARNNGLDAVAAGTDYIAFLDSDDSWHAGHLRRGIEALERGCDMYFCDNRRDDVHASHFASGALFIPYIKKSTISDGVIAADKDELLSILIQEFPAQTSTIIYKHACAPDMQFNTSLKHAGEDKLFFVQLASMAQRICFSPDIMVDCGTGVNMYFGHTNWDSPSNLRQVIDDLRSHYFIRKIVSLSPNNRAFNDAAIVRLRRKVAFLSLRQCIKHQGRWPRELQLLAREEEFFYGWFAFCAAQVAMLRAFGLYSPS